MPDSNNKEHAIVDIIREILRKETYPVNRKPHEKKHHLRPYLSSYQIAIKLKTDYSDEKAVEALNLKVGGKG